jgi:hypothetical protein
VDENSIEVTQSRGKFTVTRLNTWDTNFQLTAQFNYDGEDHWEDTWYHVNGKDYNIWFDQGSYDIYNARTIYLTKSDDLKKFSKYSIAFDVECHNKTTDRWVGLDESAYSVDVSKGSITINASKLSQKYDCGDIHAVLKINGSDERNTWCHFELKEEKCPHHVMTTTTVRNATKTQTGLKRSACEFCGEEVYTTLPKLSSLTVTASKKTVKYSKVKNKAQKVAPLTVKGAAGKVTYSGKGTNAKSKKALTINKTTGKITVKKKTKKGTYKMKVTVKDPGSATVQGKTITKTVTIVVK